MASTVYDIARAASVSTTTVLRALWDKGEIRPETKERILRIAAEMNYRPNLVARSLTMGRSRFVGVMTTSFDCPDILRRHWAHLSNSAEGPVCHLVVFD